MSRPPPDEPVGEIKSISLSDEVESTTSLADMNLLSYFDWYGSLRERWDVSEAGAHRALDDFLGNKL